VYINILSRIHIQLYIMQSFNTQRSHMTLVMTSVHVAVASDCHVNTHTYPFFAILLYLPQSDY